MNPDQSPDWTKILFQTINESCHPDTITAKEEFIIFLTSKGADPNATDSSGYTPLYHSVKLKDVNLTRLLIKLGADVNKQYTNGCIALQQALQNKHLEMVHLLLEHKSSITSYMKQKFFTDLSNGGTRAHTRETFLKTLIDDGFEIDYIDRHRRTYLHNAVLRNLPQTVTALIANGAKFQHGYASSQCKNDNRLVDPFNSAIWLNLAEIVKLMLEKGADIHYTYYMRGKMTPFKLALMYKRIDILRLMLPEIKRIGWTRTHFAAYINDINDIAKDEINISTIGGNRPIHFATHYGNFDLVKSLVKNGAKVNVTNKDKISPLLTAIDRENYEIAEFLLQHSADPNMPNEHYKTPLFRAVKINNIRMVKLLIKYEVNILKSESVTILYMAIKSKSLELVKLIFEADVGLFKNDGSFYYSLNERCYNMAMYLNQVFKKKWSPLHFAAHQFDLDKIKSLTKNEADVNATTDDGNTSLHILLFSFIKNRWFTDCKTVTEMAKLLLDHGAEINAVNRNGNRPIHLISFDTRHKDLVQIFIDGGADLMARNGTGKTLLYLAIQEFNIPLVKQLLKHGLNINSRNKDGKTAIYAAVAICVPLMDVLIKHKAKVNISDMSGTTPLHHAVVHGGVYIVKSLIGHKAKLDVRDKDGNLPLHLASGTCKTAVVRTLLEYSPDPNVVNNDEVTPLHLVVSYHVAELLLRYKAKVDAVDKSGKTPSEYAKQRKKDRIVKLLDSLTHKTEGKTTIRRKKKSTKKKSIAGRSSVKRKTSTGRSSVKRKNLTKITNTGRKKKSSRSS